MGSNEDYSGGSRKDRRLQELQEDGPHESIKGAPEPDILYLYITCVDNETTERQLESHILREFDKVSRARVRRTEQKNHSFYASFTVTVIGEGLDMEQDFINNTEVFPKPIKIFPNRNKYWDDNNDGQRV